MNRENFKKAQDMLEAFTTEVENAGIPFEDFAVVLAVAAKASLGTLRKHHPKEYAKVRDIIIGAISA